MTDEYRELNTEEEKLLYKLFNPYKMTLREKISCGVSILIAILLITPIILFAIKYGKYFPLPTHPPGSQTIYNGF
jgi:hypothetical protein